MTINFNPDPADPSAPDGGLDAWLAGAELIVVRFADDGWVERTIDIADFPLLPAPLPGPPQGSPRRIGG